MRFSTAEYLELGRILSVNWPGQLAMRNSYLDCLCRYYEKDKYWNSVYWWFDALAIAQSALDTWEEFQI